VSLNNKESFTRGIELLWARRGENVHCLAREGESSESGRWGAVERALAGVWHSRPGSKRKNLGRVRPGVWRIVNERVCEDGADNDKEIVPIEIARLEWSREESCGEKPGGCVG